MPGSDGEPGLVPSSDGDHKVYLVLVMVTSRITRVPAGSDTTTPSESRIHAGSSVVERVLLPGSDGEPAGLRGSDGVQDSYVVLMVNGDFLVLMVNQDYYLVLMVTSTRITWFRYSL